MRTRPITLIALLAACAPPEQEDTGAALAVPLPGAGARVELGLEGLWLSTGEDGLGLSTEAWGREGSLTTQPLGAPRDGGCWPGSPRLRPWGCQPTLERPLAGGLERWTRAGGGVQQGWTLTEAPSGDGPLVIEVAVSGAEPRLDGERVRLTTPAGGRWTYAGLEAWDDRGRDLDAWMTVEGDLIRVWVDDTDATWPVHIDPVLSTATTTLTESSTDFGIGVALGGDVNNDGYADALVGARFGTGLYGEAFSYHGSSSGLSTTESRSWRGSDYYGKYGEYVDNGGDVNGDGYDDGVVCEFYSERFFVYHGSSSGLGSSSSTTVTGVYGLGRGLEIVGDFNNDGYDDVAAGSQEPEIDFYRGSSSGLNSTSVLTYSTTDSPSVSRAGDVNGDGYDDVVYGDAAANAMYVVRGASSFPGTKTTLTRSGSSELGFDVAGGGDIDGDGYDDVVGGDPTYSSSNGRLVVFYGSSSGVSTSNYDVISAPSSGTGFGYTVQLVGDVNGDGYDDVAVSDDYDHSYTYVYHGSSSGLESSPASTLNIGDANFGYSIGGKPGGDVTNDGFDDVLIGTIGSTAYLYEGCQDADGDGECEDLDCDDTDSAINTSATEICDDKDNDCDGLTDDSDTSLSSAGKSTFYRDADSDGYGVSTSTRSACDAPSGYVSNDDDCNDSSSSINPGATETTGDGTDSNCDGRETCYADADNDSYRTTTTVSSTDSDCSDSGEALSSETSGDCNDSSSSINPGATETTGDGTDSNCDGLETCYADADNDNYRTSTTVSSTDSDCSDSGEALSSDTSGDCDDADSAINPAASEVCDGEDNDCDGYTDTADTSVDSSTVGTYYDDDDSDGYGDASDSTRSCSLPTGYVTNDDDCNDASASINPGATETTGDGTDSNCDGRETCYADADNDSYRTTTTVSSTDSDCSDSGEALSSETSGDCNDSSSSINPGATETTGDGTDSNCDGLETCYADGDNDSYRTSTTVSSSDSDCTDSGEALSSESSGDCDDADSAINPAASEVCDGEDNDCDGYTDTADTSVDSSTVGTYYDDDDSDGYGDASDSTRSCSVPTGYVNNDDDCNDTSASINPGATETTGDGTDSDCDGAETCYADADNDSYRTSTTVSSTDSDCSDSGEALSSDSSGDCDDADSAINPGATETAGDGTDSDCDGLETCYADGDDDGYRTTSTVSSTDSDCTDSGEALSSESSGDCDDADATINPAGSEVCDGEDNDCDGYTDSADSSVDTSTQATYYADTDDDGYGDPASTTDSCDLPDGYVNNADDCDDSSGAINPSVEETVGDAVDADCDGVETCYADADVDGYRVEETVSSADVDCSDEGEALESDSSGDCDDADSSIYPGASDPDYDGIDQDCGGYTDDLDGDGYDAEEAGGDDCDDTDATVYVGAEELADGKDNDCDGQTEAFDGDGDGLTDMDEDTLGTDPADADTDDDTLSDGEEVLQLETDPLDDDSDGGGLDDGTEVGRGSDPNDAADDGLPISWVKGGCSCASTEQRSSGLVWLLGLLPALIRRKSR